MSEWMGMGLPPEICLPEIGPKNFVQFVIDFLYLYMIFLYVYIYIYIYMISVRFCWQSFFVYFLFFCIFSISFVYLSISFVPISKARLEIGNGTPAWNLPARNRPGKPEKFKIISKFGPKSASKWIKVGPPGRFWTIFGPILGRIWKWF